MSQTEKKPTLKQTLFTKYKLQLFSESSLEALITLHVSRFGVVVTLVIFVILMSSVAGYFLLSTPLKYFMPGFVKHETTVEIVDNALRIDSLAGVARLNEAYLQNFYRIITDQIEIDSISPIESDSLWLFPVDSLHDLSPRSEQYIANYEREESYSLQIFNTQTSPEGIIFQSPISGVVVDAFTPHAASRGISIRSPRATTVVATFDGTVVSAYYSLDHDYVIEVQHGDNYLSKYKNSTALLKKEGDRVKAGDPLALLGDKNSTAESLPLLQFELWHNGEPVDPTLLMTF